jgi:mono/diheme cytochrome c family protein
MMTIQPLINALSLIALLACSAFATSAAEAMKQGEDLYNAAGSCVACHMADGAGQPGSIPPLAGSDWLKGSPERTIAIVLRGLAGPIKVNGDKFYSAMPPQVLFNDEQLAAIISYANNAWGNKGAMVTAAQVAAARKSLPTAVYTPQTVLKAFPFDTQLAKTNGSYTQNLKAAETADKEAIVYRTFMPGASPAAFAVALPGNQYYCWDAGECRLRYVWSKGGFIRGNERHWSSNGKPVAQFDGIPYYRARSSLLKAEHYKDLANTNMGTPFYDTSQAQDFPISIGDAAGPPRFRGYRLVDGYPEFRYTLGEHLIRERIRPTDDGLGIVRQFTVPTEQPVSVRLTASPECQISASAGQLAEDGSLQLTPAEAKSFAVTITETHPASSLPGGGQ